MTGLFGGTFDPIHVGHLDVARAARTALNLDVVWLVPSNVPPHRSLPRASAAHRFAMVALAVQAEDRLLVSDLEMNTSGPSYTADTLERLQSRGVSLGNVCFVIGADAFRDIAVWRDYPEVLDRCHFAVVSRPGIPVSELRRLLPDLASRMIDVPCVPPARPSILLVDAPTSPVSSTDIRRASAAGSSLEGLVPASVAAHISRHRLYGRARGGPE
jgi:nicotinate-nucleotide adenylyltransferase